MSADRLVVVEISRIEAAHLATLVRQFAELVAESDPDTDDPAVGRLLPDAYPADAEAGREFRSATADELLRRRAADAELVLVSLGDAAVDPAELGADVAGDELAVARAGEEVGSWLRTLAAVRLVLASRLGIESEDDDTDDDPRRGIYDWLGYRLDALVEAVEGP